MGSIVNDSTDGSSQYYPSPQKNDGDIITPLIVFGSFVGLGYILNNYFFNSKAMGQGRIYNNDIEQYAQAIQDLEDYPSVNRKPGWNPKMYRTHNIAYPDVLYEKLPYPQAKPDNAFIHVPIPAADRVQLQYAEPSNVISEEIMYEQGTPDLREDYRLTGVLDAPATKFGRRTPGGLEAGTSNTIFTTEYAPGLNEKVRRDNPKVVEKIMTPAGKKATVVHRLAPLRPAVARRFNTDYDSKGNPIQREKPVYDTLDYLSDLYLTNEDYGEGEPGGRVSSETVSVFEDFITKGRLRQGYEVIPSED
jgi:hypothetical protein